MPSLWAEVCVTVEIIHADASEDYCRMARERTAQMGLMETA